jgi:inosine/xanthosine triphosphate pyrophosphatase family protein
MPDLTFVTGNPLKFAIASSAFAGSGVRLVQQNLEIDEIQSENSEYIVRKKAEAAFTQLGRPVVANDDSWSLLGLHGFPGPYLKSMNHWFAPEDWYHLTASLKDRRIELKQLVAYHDGNDTHIFTNVIPGLLLAEPRGTSPHSSQTIMTLEGDDGLSIAEALNRDAEHYSKRPAAKVWQEFASWYKNNHKDNL